MTQGELLAWAAGFLDGEGYFGAMKQGHYRILSVKVFQKDRAVLDRLYSIFPYGAISVTRKKGEEIGWTWVVSRFEHSQQVIAALWKFLAPVKRKQCHVALETMRHYFREERPWKWQGTSRWGDARPGTCMTEGCEEPHHSMGFCRRHYRRDYDRRKRAAG